MSAGIPKKKGAGQKHITSPSLKNLCQSKSERKQKRFYAGIYTGEE